MNEIACYILYSQKLDKFYIGYTQDSTENRLDKHNQSSYGSKYTSITNDWEMYLSIQCQTVSQARKIELHIKKAKSKVYISNLKKYSEIIEKLLLKYSVN